ncbi:MAG: 50S ribosomal protein L6 [Armatimonadetes bacterium]|nr:50S ribosomal protein L6 [Armatimonadota bacterium]
MSRIGNKPIPIPDGVQVTVQPGNVVVVKAGKKELSFQAHPSMAIKVEEGQVVVERPSDRKMHKALHGTTRALIGNMIQGVTEGFTRVLELHGLGYRAQMQGKRLVLQVGLSHEVSYEPPEGVEIEVEPRNPSPPSYLSAIITVRGADKQKVGQAAAEIRRVRPVEPYKGKGLRYQDEHVRRKAGKAGRVAT